MPRTRHTQVGRLNASQILPYDLWARICSLLNVHSAHALVPGGAIPRVLGRQLPLPPPPPLRGLRPTVSCQRCRPQASMGA